MRTSDLDELIRTVELIRATTHPELDAAFLRAVVAAEESNPEDDAQAMRDIESALRLLLSTRGSG